MSEAEIEATPPDQPAEAASQPTAAELAQALAEAQAKTAEYLDGWQRARAELDNYRKRTQKEQAEIQQVIAARLIARFLEVQDDFDRALQDRPTAESNDEIANKWADGVGLIYRKLQNMLAAEGVTRMEVDGQAFDPARHEAATHEECADCPSGHILGVIRHGYQIGDRVVRPALVRVAK